MFLQGGGKAAGLSWQVPVGCGPDLQQGLRGQEPLHSGRLWRCGRLVGLTGHARRVRAPARHDRGTDWNWDDDDE